MQRTCYDKIVSLSPRFLPYIRTHLMVAIGLAIPLPSMSGAEP
jgi:hypothetical protein